MKTIYTRELKNNLKYFLIWSLVVGGLGMACLLMFDSMKGDMANMADSFSKMGAFSDAFGMSTLSIATVKGFFATEVGTVHGLGGAMFAAILAICILSKEEEGHTGEFLLSLPVKRWKVVASKGMCVLTMILGFTLVCGVLYAIGFAVLGEELPTSEFLSFLLRQMLMNLEVAGICFAISALSGRNRMGLGIGIALICYIFDLIGRVVPAIKDYIFLGPYSYANASEILSGQATPVGAILLGLALTLITPAFAIWWYNRRDLAA